MAVQIVRRALVLLLVPAVFVASGTAAIAPQHDDDHYADSHAAAPAKAAAHGEPKRETPAARAPADESEPAIRREAAKPAAKSKTEKTDEPMTAAAALKMLQDGNQRWVSDKEENPSTDPSRRSMLAEKGQKPFVTILTCADSRLPVERLFDRGVGEIFVVRVAGNVAGVSETGTIEYGIEHLKTPLLVVMGHTKCGAVAAAASGTELHGSLGELVAAIAPAVDRAKRNNPEADAKQIAPLAVKENVWQSITDLLRRSPEVRSAVSKNEVRVVGAVCDIATGKVEWMGEHPWQAELVEAFNSRPSPHAPASTAAPARSSPTADAESHSQK